MLNKYNYNTDEFSSLQNYHRQTSFIELDEEGAGLNQKINLNNFVSEAVADFNPLSLYLAEMSNHKRITRERELILGKIIQKGQEIMVALTLDTQVRFKEMTQLKTEVISWLEKKRRPNYSENEIMSMIKQTFSDLACSYPENHDLISLSRRMNRVGQKVHEAKEELISSNLRLVVKIAKGYLNRGLDLMDLIQEGNIGLMKAASKYDYTRKTRFSTYASLWIKQSIIKAIYDKGRTIRLPVHQIEKHREFFKTYYKLFKELEREPTLTELSEDLGIKLENVCLIFQHLADPISLESTMADEKTYFKDSLLGDDGSSFLENTFRMEIKESVRRSVDNLPQKEAEVIKNRFGLTKEESLSLNALGHHIGISGERVRQIEAQALKRLRNPLRRKVLETLI